MYDIDEFINYSRVYGENGTILKWKFNRNYRYTVYV